MKTPRHLPFEAWPPEDLAAWHAATRPAGLFEDAGRAAHWQASTRAQRSRSYGYWLRYCQTRRIAPDPGGTIADRVTPQTVAGYVGHLRQTISINAVATYVGTFSWVIRALCPDRDWGWLKAVVRRLERQVTGPVVDKRPCLRDAGVLVELGFALMDGAAALLLASREQADSLGLKPMAKSEARLRA